MWLSALVVVVVVGRLKDEVRRLMRHHADDSSDFKHYG